MVWSLPFWEFHSSNDSEYARLFTELLLPVLLTYENSALYAHKFHTLWWNDVEEPEKWGFASECESLIDWTSSKPASAVYLIISLENQVTPFRLPTVDGVDLYLWHILPLALYTQHEASLSQSSRVPLDKYTSSNAFKFLKEDPEARLILSCQ